MYEGHTLIKCLGEFPGPSVYCLLVKCLGEFPGPSVYCLLVNTLFFYKNQENRPDVQCSNFEPVFQPQNDLNPIPGGGGGYFSTLSRGMRYSYLTMYLPGAINPFGLIFGLYIP